MHESNWQKLELLLAYASGKKDVKKGVEAIKALWTKNKAWMIPYFDENGQKIVAVQADPGHLFKEALSEGMKIAAAISANDKYKDVIKDNGAGVMRFISGLMPYVVTSQELASNRLEHDKLNPMTNKKMTAGTKTLKFVEAYIQGLSQTQENWRWNNLHMYDRGQVEIIYNYIVDVCSQVIGLTKVRNDFAVLSINPIDMLLCSAHNIGWSSCHNIFSGEYRFGVVGMVCDPATAIGFVYQNIEKVDKCDFEWPKKMWRRFVYTSKDDRAALFGSDYNSSIYGKPAVLQMTAEMLARYYNCSPEFKTAANLSYCGDSKGEQTKARCGLNRSNWQSVDGPSQALRLVEGGKYPNYVDIGLNSVPCVSCGRTRTYGKSAGYSHELDCGSCYSTHTCHNCGHGVTKDDSIRRGCYRFCKACFNDLYITCADCGKITRRSRSVTVKKDGKIVYVCSSCKKIYERCQFCGYYHPKRGLFVSNVNGKIWCSRCKHYTKDELKELVPAPAKVAALK